MFWELTLLNRLYKENDFCKVKARMHLDRIIFVHNQSDRFATTLYKSQKEDKFISEARVLQYFNIEYSEVGHIANLHSGSEGRENDKEYY
jgi:hypothetical protein